MFILQEIQTTNSNTAAFTITLTDGLLGTFPA